MPKGVDHSRKTTRRVTYPEVQKSLMPKGVDHQQVELRASLTRRAVQKSLMPKGVDHLTHVKELIEQNLESAKIFDAERR